MLGIFIFTAYNRSNDSSEATEVDFIEFDNCRNHY